MTNWEKKIVRHMSRADLDYLLTETTDNKVRKQLTFVKRLYKGAALANAADDVEKSGGAGSRWATRWNEDGLGKLTPNFGDGRPPKLGDDGREHLLELLREGPSWKKQERYSTFSTKDLMSNITPEIPLKHAIAAVRVCNSVRQHGQ